MEDKNFQPIINQVNPTLQFKDKNEWKSKCCGEFEIIRDSKNCVSPYSKAIRLKRMAFLLSQPEGLLVATKAVRKNYRVATHP